MTDPVKPARRYDASRRREQARRSRLAVLSAARARFLADGYRPTTLAAIAAEADVSVDSIYKAFGGKAGVLKALFDVSVVGDDEPVPLIDRPLMRQWQAETDPRRLLHSYCDYLGRSQAEAVPVELLARAAAADPEAAQVWTAIRAEALTGMTAFAAHLHRRGFLRPDRTPDDARDILWTYIGPALYEGLVLGRGWSVDRYSTFVAEALIAALLPA